jgi:hypothetical protein
VFRDQQDLEALRLCSHAPVFNRLSRPSRERRTTDLRKQAPSAGLPRPARRNGRNRNTRPSLLTAGEIDRTDRACDPRALLEHTVEHSASPSGNELGPACGDLKNDGHADSTGMA